MEKSSLIIFGTIAILGFTFLINLFITKRLASKTQTGISQEDWDIGGRNLPWYVVAGTQFASAMGGGVLVAHVGNAYGNGLSVLLYGLISASSLLAIGLISKWLREKKFVTISDVLQSFTGKNKAVAILAGLLALCVPFGWITSQLVAFAKLYSSMTGLSQNTLIIVLSVISIAFVLPAGLKTVAWTDFIFAIFILLSAGFTVFYVTDMAGGFSSIVANVPAELIAFPDAFFNIGGYTVLLWVLAVLPGGMTNQLYFQRAGAIDNPKKIRLTMNMSFLLVCSTTVYSCIMGVAIRSMNANLQPEMATGWFMDQLPLWFLTIFAGLIVCTILSTVSSGVQTVVVNVTRDIYATYKPDASEKSIVTLSRILAVLVIALAAILSIFSPTVLGWLVNTYAYSAAGLFVPIYLGYVMKDKNFVTSQGVIASMICGIAGCVISSALGATYLPFVAYGLMASLVSFVVVCSLTKNTKIVEA